MTRTKMVSTHILEGGTDFVLMGAMAKQDDYVRYTVRIPQPLYEQVQEAAGEKSVNAEIVERLMRSFRPENHAANVIEDLRIKLFEIEETLNRTLEKEAEVMIRREQKRK